MKRKLLRIALILAIAIPVLALISELRFRTSIPDVYSGGRNGMWLRHSWVGDSRTVREYDDLAAMLKRMGITDAFFHAGPFRGDGTIPPAKYSYAPDLIRNIRRTEPDIRLYVWLGQVEAKGGGLLDISYPQTRETILRTATRFLEMGFDGIHLNIEPIYSNDPDYLDLLRALHKVTNELGKRLSVSAYKPERIPGTERIVRRVSRNPGYWQKEYFLKVAREVDQVVVMTYDSGYPLPSMYGNSISRTAKWCIENGIDDLLIGIPSYDEYKGGHFPYVENLDNALLGLKQGVSTLDEEDRSKVGASIYAEWTTSDAERETFISKWVQKNRDGRL